MKFYLATLERFGYVLTAVDKTKKGATDTVLKSYTEAYIASNNVDPKEDIMETYPVVKTFYDLAKEELYVTPINTDECLWL